jgi:hypothetical protein
MWKSIHRRRRIRAVSLFCNAAAVMCALFLVAGNASGFGGRFFFAAAETSWEAEVLPRKGIAQANDAAFGASATAQGLSGCPNDWVLIGRACVNASLEARNIYLGAASLLFAAIAVWLSLFPPLRRRGDYA